MSIGPLIVSVNTTLRAVPSEAICTEVTKVTLRPTCTPLRGRLLSSCESEPPERTARVTGGDNRYAWRSPLWRPHPTISPESSIALAASSTHPEPAGRREFRSVIVPRSYRKACVPPPDMSDVPTIWLKEFSPVASLFAPPSVPRSSIAPPEYKNAWCTPEASVDRPATSAPSLTAGASRDVPSVPRWVIVPPLYRNACMVALPAVDAQPTTSWPSLAAVAALFVPPKVPPSTD